MISFQLKGLDDIQAKLANLTYDAKRKGGRAALRKAAQLVRDDAIRRAQALDDPQSAENISKNIAERWNGRLFKTTGNIGFRIGVLGGARDESGKIPSKKAVKANPGGDTFYWRFVEFGTENMKARPFMRPALATNVDKATDVFVTEFNKGIDRALKKAAKR